MTQIKPIRVLIVDDSTFMRSVLTDILSSDPELHVVDTAENPYDAREKIKRHNPDVITLDIEMPQMHGLDFLERIMTLRPMPVVMISALTGEGAEMTLRALELGAVDVVGKPTGSQESLRDKRAEIVTKVKAAAKARVRPLAKVADQPKPAAFSGRSNVSVVAIGASTGGVEALREVLSAMPAEGPPVVITQHMPEAFVPAFARRLDGLCEIGVSQARDGDRLERGHAYIAPGNQHLTLAKSARGYLCRLRDGDRVSGHRPSVDVLFESVAACAGQHAIGVILTGMGRDGASGLLAMRQAGGCTIGQDEQSSMVYGMPRVAFENGAVEEQLALGRITHRIIELCSLNPASH